MTEAPEQTERDKHLANADGAGYFTLTGAVFG